MTTGPLDWKFSASLTTRSTLANCYSYILPYDYSHSNIVIEFYKTTILSSTKENLILLFFFFFEIAALQLE